MVTSKKAAEFSYARRAPPAVVTRQAGPDVVRLISGYFAVGEPSLLHELCATARPARQLVARCRSPR